MEKYLTEEQVKTILDNAPKGADQDKLIEGLVNRGYTLQGLNDQPEKSQESPSAATFKATGNESLISGAAKAVGNIPSSGVNLAKNVIHAVANPLETATNVGKTLVGGGEALGHAVGLGDKTQIRPEEQQFNDFLGALKERYGGLDNIKKTLIEDPVGAAADISALLSGGSTAAAKLGLADTATTLSKASQVAEPMKLASTVKNMAKDSTVGKVLSDVSPTSYKIQQGQVVKALELTPGDLANITKKTQNDVTNFVVKNDLIKGTPEEVVHSLDELRKQRMAEVRGEIANVKTTYTPEQVPSFKKSLDLIASNLKDVSGLESQYAEVNALANKKVLSLEDIQRAKELVDENYDIYSASGDVKQGTQARGLDVMRKELRKTIEDEVTKNTNGQTNIQQLNNDVQTTKELQNAIEKRQNKGMSRQYITAFDLIAGTTGTAAFGPLAGVGLVVAKKIAESPAFRLKVAKLLSAQPIQYVKTLTKEMANKTLSESTRKTLSSILEEAQKNLPYIESGSNLMGQQEPNKQ